MRVKPRILTDWEKIQFICEWKYCFESSCTPRSITENFCFYSEFNNPSVAAVQFHEGSSTPYLCTFDITLQQIAVVN